MNLQILFNNPGGSLVISIVKFISAVFISYYVIKLLYNFLLFQNLKKKYGKINTADHAEFSNLLTELCKKIGLNRIPDIYYFADKNPLIFAYGLLRPAVFISPKLLSTLNYGELKAVLTHELTHINRYDSLIIFLTKFVQALIPLAIITSFGYEIISEEQTPFFWYLLTFILLLSYQLFIKEKIIYQRELTCDDLTLNVIGDPLLLAESIVKVWQESRRLPAYKWQMNFALVSPFASEGVSNNGRIKRLLNYKRPVYKVFFRNVMKYALTGMFVISSVFFIEFLFTDVHAMIFYENDKIHMNVRKGGLVTVKEKNADTKVSADFYKIVISRKDKSLKD